MNKDKLKAFAVSIFFPKRCRYCGELIRYDETLCEECKKGLPVIEAPVCHDCGMSKSDCESIFTIRLSAHFTMRALFVKLYRE